MKNGLKCSYNIEMSIFMLYNYLVMIEQQLLLPPKYSNKLKKMQKELSDVIFKRPNVDYPIVLDKTIYTITDIWKKDFVQKK